jgi:uncharacterized protein YndB with AHSA1/START domain
MTEHRERILRIERTFEAPIEKVFDAWTNADVLRRWLHVGPDWETPVAEAELLVMRDPEDGAQYGARGEYLLIERPRRLVFTWTFDHHPDDEQLIELEFSKGDGVTSVVMINSGIGTEERWREQRRGWRGCYDNLERTLAVS